MIFLNSWTFSKLTPGRPLFFQTKGDSFHTPIHSLSLPVDHHFNAFRVIFLLEHVLAKSVFFCTHELFIM